MNTLLTPRKRQTSHGSDDRGPRVWWRVLLPLALLLLNLACVRMEQSWKITQREGQEDLVTVTVSQQVTDEYLEAARRANAEREADYRAAGREMLDEGFIDTREEATELLMGGAEDLQAEGFQVVPGNGGFTAEASYTLSEFLATLNEESGVRLRVERDRPEGVAYIFEVDLQDPEIDMAELDALRQGGLPPKPALEPPDDTPSGESFYDFIGIIVDVLNLEGTDLDAWYGQRIMMEAGLPVTEIVVELPGQIVLSEVSGVPHGQVDRNRVTLVVGEDFYREFGAIGHLFRVESLVSICEQDCNEPHMIWDGMHEYPVCTCICEKGWEMRFEGCVDCETICREQDPPAVYDEAASGVNNCVCQVPSDQASSGPSPVASGSSGGLLPDAQAPGPTPSQAAAGAVATAAAVAATAAAAAAASNLATAIAGGKPAPSAPPSAPTTAPTTSPPAPAPTQVPSAAPTQVATAPPTQVKPPAQPSPLQPVANMVRDRIEQTLNNPDPQTGQGQVDFGVRELTDLLPPEIPLTRTEDGNVVDLGTVKNVIVTTDSRAGTITVEFVAHGLFNDLVNGPARITVRPTVQGGQLQLQVQEATVKAFGVLDTDVMQVADVVDSIPGLSLFIGDVRTHVTDNLTRAVSGVNQTISNMGGQLQNVTVGPNGIQISLRPTK